MSIFTVMSLVITCAGLMGAAGVMLAAAAAHGRPGAGLDSAGYILLIHAAALFGGVNALHHSFITRMLGLTALCAFVIGAALFAGDVTLRAWRDRPLFRMAAPTGGVVLIVGWLVLAAASVSTILGGY